MLLVTALVTLQFVAKLWGTFDIPIIQSSQYVNVTITLNVTMLTNNYKVFFSPSLLANNWSRVVAGATAQQPQQFIANCYNNATQNSSAILQKHYLLIGY